MSDFEVDLESIDTENDIGLGDEDKGKVGNKAEWYKGEKGRTDRVSLVYFNDVKTSALRRALRAKPDLAKDKEGQKRVVIDTLQKLAEKLGKTIDQLDPVDMLDVTEARFKTASASFKEGLGYVEWPKKLSAEEEKVWKKLGEKREYVFTVLLQYPTDREGDLDRERLAKGWRVLPWRFAPDKFEVIRKINKGLAESGSTIASIDLNFACTDTNYQKITITQAGPCIYLKNDKLRRMVLEKAVGLYEKLSLRQLTTDELREKLGLTSASTGGGGAGDVGGEDFANLLSGV